jgi:hypothetical protein
MAVSEDSRNGATEGQDYKEMYKNLKRKFLVLLQENESFSAELRRCQGEFLQASKDNDFLLERLMQYENQEDSCTDDDATDSSDDEGKQSIGKKAETDIPSTSKAPAKRKDKSTPTTTTKKKKVKANGPTTTPTTTPKTTGKTTTTSKGLQMTLPSPVSTKVGCSSTSSESVSTLISHPQLMSSTFKIKDEPLTASSTPDMKSKRLGSIGSMVPNSVTLGGIGSLSPGTVMQTKSLDKKPLLHQQLFPPV